MIYYDNAATTFICEAAKEALTKDYGNPSSLHSLGLEAERGVKRAAKYIAGILNCGSDEIYFTSGGTESNNIGIIGAVKYKKSKHKRDINVLISYHEHPSVIEPLKSFEGVNLMYTEDFSLCSDIDVVCISQVSSETGDRFNIGEIAAKVKAKNPDAIIFSDGAQGFCKADDFLNDVDIYTFSGHKINGPMGIGGMFIRKRLNLQPLYFGGGQQRKMRPGTENVSGILGMTAAIKHNIENTEENHANVSAVNKIISSLASELPNVHINKTGTEVSAYILNMSFVGLRGEVFCNLLSEHGIYVSTGTACRAAKKNSALTDMGFSKSRAESSIRFSFSGTNTIEEAIRAKEIIKNAAAKLY